LLLLDLDHFKRVNDLYGHATGDRLLATCSSIIREEVPSGACAARLGGDEFAILLHGAEEVTAERVAQNILRRFAEGLVLGDTFAHVSASIGGSLVQHQQVQPEEALRRSDIAMYEAKARGRKRFVWFDKTMETALNKRNELEADIRAGVDAGQFVPYYQPLVHLNTGEIKGFEVLARWQHPRLGVVQPESFVPLAEASNLIGDISFSVMRQAFIQAKSWPDAITLAVNVSPVQFKDPLLASRVVQLLTATGFPAQRLEIEITESAIFDDGQLALETVESLKNSGIRISLDDFGTGYASLTQLRAIPFDRIKIDRSFVACMLEDQQSGAIVSTIAKLGGSLCLPITAEGVETEAVRKVLQRLGCSDAQGWLFGKAMPAEEAARLIGGPPFESAPVPTGPELVVGHNERRDQKRRARGQQAAA
jgi:diguanylate cyclase (GGDEF)-like protein